MWRKKGFFDAYIKKRRVRANVHHACQRNLGAFVMCGWCVSADIMCVWPSCVSGPHVFLALMCVWPSYVSGPGPHVCPALNHVCLALHHVCLALPL